MKELLLLIFTVWIAYPFTYFSAIETLNTIQKIINNKQKGALLRFGDGDLALAHGVRSGTHMCTPQLQQEMKEAFAMNDAYILKTLPILCSEHGGPEVELFYGKHKLSEKSCADIIDKAQKIWGKEIEHIYSPVALPYTAVVMPQICIDFLIFIKNQNCELFVGNRNMPRNLIKLLFGDCPTVSTPYTSAYKVIDSIEKDCLKKISTDSNHYRLIIVSCGNTSRVLIKRLWPLIQNVFFLDMGSLMDALCGWHTRGWIRNTQFNAQHFLESFTKCLSDRY